MRAKSTVMLVFALGCGIAASFGVQELMRKRVDDAPSEIGHMEAILVAAKTIPIGDSIDVKMLRLERWPKDRVPPGAITKLERVEGRRPAATIWEGSPILESLFSAVAVTAAEEKPSVSIPEGFRAEAVKLDPTSGDAEMIRLAQRVDVLVHVEADAAKRIPETITRTILQDVQVFAVNAAGGAAQPEGEEPKTPGTVWLLVTPEQAETLTLAGQLGTIRLVTRSPEDKEHKRLAGATASKLLKESAETAAVAENTRDTQDQGDTEAATPENLATMLGIGQKAPEEASAAPASSADTQTTSWSIRILAGSLATDSVLQARLPSDRGNSASRAGHGIPD